MIFTTTQAKKQDAIRRIYQPMWKAYRWSADGCGDNLYDSASLALQAFNWHVLTGQVITNRQILTEHA